jgi:hypothetical protein
MSAVADPTAMRATVAAACPGRTAALIDGRVAQLHGLAAEPLPGDLDPAERCLMDVVEVFVADVHALDDAQFAALARHYPPGDVVAMMFHAGLCDGFAKHELAVVPA